MMRLLQFAAATFLIVAAAQAQAILDAKIARGDDPRWADPQFDDSNWTPLTSEQPVRFADLKDNVVWTRARVTVPSDRPMLFRATCAMDCRLWIDGKAVNDPGGKRTIQVIAPAPPGATVTVAVRSWLPPGAAVYNRSSGVIELLPAAGIGANPGGWLIAWDLLPQKITALVQAAILFYLLLQAFTGKSSREVHIRAGLMAAFLLCAVVSFGTRDPRIQWTSSMGTLPTILAILALAGGSLPRSWIYAFIPCFLAIRLPYLIGMFSERAHSWTGFTAQLHAASLPLAMIVAVWLSWRASRRGATGWVMVCSWIAILAFFVNATRPSWLPVGFRAGDLLFLWNNFGSVTFGLAIAVDVVRQSRREQAAAVRLKGEMDSGRQVQLDLVSASSPETPGYQIGVEYHPAAEVGGDFYLVLPRRDGATLVVVGDVSGKGLKAAMLASFVIGVIRTHRDDSARAILAAVNEALDGDTKGFITACVAVLDREGRMEYASAGHLPPWLSGREMQVPDALPLGLVKGIDFTEAAWRLEPGVQLTLLTDGVVEAANAKGELFGFDRTAAVSTSPAAQIAHTARAWGQNDDITVVTVRRVA